MEKPTIKRVDNRKRDRKRIDNRKRDRKPRKNRKNKISKVKAEKK